MNENIIISITEDRRIWFVVVFSILDDIHKNLKTVCGCSHLFLNIYSEHDLTTLKQLCG